MPPPVEGFAARLVLGPALRAQPDRRLVTLVREGYESAFEEIVRRYGKPLTRYAAAIVGGRAEDVTQDAFSKALLALRRDGNEIELRPWLFRIVRNTALNELRDRPPSPELLAEEIAGGGSPAEVFERREELADLMQRLRSLPEPQRAAIVMRELEGLSHEEIAKALGVSGGAARQAIFRARRALRGGLGALLPMPLLKALLAGTAEAPVEAAVGAASVGGGAAGAGVALKAATATVLVAGAVGAGVAVHDGRQDQQGRPAVETRSERTVADDSLAAPVDDRSTDESGGGNSGRGSEDRGSSGSPETRGDAEHGDDHGGGGTQPGASSGPGSGRTGAESSPDHSGRGSGHEAGTTGGGGGPGPSGGDDTGSGGSGHSPGGSSSGSGSSGSGSGERSGSNSGPGSGSISGGEATPASAEVTESGGGPGPSSGSSGSGSGSSDSGGGGDDGVNLEGSSDSHDGSGLSLQRETQT